MVLELVRPSEPWCFPAGSCFFRSCFSCERPQATEILEKGLFFLDFRRDVRHFFGVVLELARPSEPWCFPCRELLFSQLFSCERPRATEILEKGCFSRISDGDVRHFFGVVLELARPSEPWCFPAGSCFFRSCFPAKKVVRPSEPWCFPAGGCF